MNALRVEKHPLAAVLAERGISKLQAAGATGIGTSRIYMLLNGQAKPSEREKTLLDALAYRLEVKASK